MHPVLKRIKIVFREVLHIKTQTKIAELLGVSGSAVSSWAKDGDVSTKNLIQISKLTKSSIHWLLTEEGEKYLSEPVLNIGDDSFEISKESIDYNNIHKRLLELEREVEIHKQDLEWLKSKVEPNADLHHEGIWRIVKKKTGFDIATISQVRKAMIETESSTKISSITGIEIKTVQLIVNAFKEASKNENGLSSKS